MRLVPGEQQRSYASKKALLNLLFLSSVVYLNSSVSRVAMNIQLTWSCLQLKSPSFKIAPCEFSPAPSNIGCSPKSRFHSFQSVGFSVNLHKFLFTLGSSAGAPDPYGQGNAASVFDFEDFLEKDWSFLDVDYDDGHIQKMDRIISAGEIAETSRVLVSAASEVFIDRMVSLSPGKEILAVHESLFVLACIKEKHDKVKCWQGSLIDLPQKWTSFDVVFLYFLPSLPFELGQILDAVAKRCVPGSRVVISHPRGRQVCEEQKQQYPDVVVSNLPEKTMLHAAAADHSFQVVEFVDEPNLYLTILRLNNQLDT